MGEPPWGDRGMDAGQGRQSGERSNTGTAADAGMRHGAQGQAAEAAGRQVQVTSMWVVLRTSRGGRERVQDKGLMATNSTDGVAAGFRGGEKISKKLVDTGGLGGVV